VENADRCIGRLLQTLPPKSYVVIASDHGGGHQRTHGTDEDSVMTVPLIFHGERIKAGELPTPVSVLDLAPTIASLAALENPPNGSVEIYFK
jgi:arylsulfatase A-like enzyme